MKHLKNYVHRAPILPFIPFILSLILIHIHFHSFVQLHTVSIFLRIEIFTFFKPPPDPNAGLSEAIQLDTQNRAKLQEMYDEILKYYGILPHQYQKSLNTAYPDLVNYIAARRKELDSRELVILVAGMYHRFLHLISARAEIP